MTLPWELTSATLVGVNLDNNPYSCQQIASNDWVSLITNYPMVIKDWTNLIIAQMVKKTNN